MAANRKQGEKQAKRRGCGIRNRLVGEADCRPRDHDRSHDSHVRRRGRLGDRRGGERSRIRLDGLVDEIEIAVAVGRPPVAPPAESPSEPLSVKVFGPVTVIVQEPLAASWSCPATKTWSPVTYPCAVTVTTMGVAAVELTMGFGICSV